MKTLKSLKENVAELKNAMEEKPYALLRNYVDSLGNNDERDLTEQEELDVFKLIVLNVNNVNAENAYQIFGELFDDFSTYKIREYMKYFCETLPDSEYLILEKHHLFNLENLSLSALADDVIKFAENNKIEIKQELINKLEKQGDFRDFIEFFNLKLKEINKSDNSRENKISENSYSVLLVENLKLALIYPDVATAIYPFFTNFAGILKKKYIEEEPTEDLIWKIYIEIQEYIAHQFHLRLPNYQEQLKYVIADTRHIPSELPQRIILNYLFFASTHPSIIPLDNVVARHFAMLSDKQESKEYKKEVDDYLKNADNIGQGIVEVVQYALTTLGVPNDRMLGFISGFSTDALETLAVAWPTDIPETARYLFTIIPTKSCQWCSSTCNRFSL